MVAYRSWSQLGQYEGCPYEYYLSRVARVWKRPAAWFPMGSAVHHSAEMWERSGRNASVVVAKAWFKESYAEETNKYLEKTPNMDWWMASGPYKGPEDIERRYRVGQEHVEKYIGYYRAHKTEKPYVLANGKPAIELPFKITLGGVEVRGLIDIVIEDQDGNLIVRDNKTGAKAGGPDQLKLYEIVLLDHLKSIGAHTTMTSGDYFMTKVGKPTVRYNLDQIPRDEMEDRFRDLERGIQAEDFPAKPSVDKCSRCPVSLSCKYKIG